MYGPDYLDVDIVDENSGALPVGEAMAAEAKREESPVEHPLPERDRRKRRRPPIRSARAADGPELPDGEAGLR